MGELDRVFSRLKTGGMRKYQFPDCSEKQKKRSDRHGR